MILIEVIETVDFYLLLNPFQVHNKIIENRKM